MRHTHVFNLSDTASSFATRMMGGEVAQLLRDAITAEKPETIYVNWAGVIAASPSFIDAFIGGAREAMQNHPHCKNMVFIGNDDYLIEAVDTVLRRRQFTVGYTPEITDLEAEPTQVLGDPSKPRLVPT